MERSIHQRPVWFSTITISANPRNASRNARRGGTSALQPAAAPPRDEVALHGHEERERGQRDEDAGGHHQPPVYDARREQILHADGQRLQLVGGDEDAREDVVV